MTARPLNIPTDLAIMPDLILRSFQYPENPAWSLDADEAKSLAEQMKFIRRVWPLIRVLGVFVKAARNPLDGMIWEENGSPAGLINVIPRGLDHKTWLIGNVSVLPEFRRRGIARKLVEAAIAHAKANAAETVILDVIAGNVPAYTLYETLGFETYGGESELSRETLPAPAAEGLPAGYARRPLTLADWKPRYELAKRITPPEAQAYQPVNAANFRIPGPMRPIVRLLQSAGPSRNHSDLIVTAEGHLAGTLNRTVRKAAGGKNEITVRVVPEHAHLAGPLVRLALAECEADAPGRPTGMLVPRWQPSVLAAALESGFALRYEGYKMGLRLS